MPDPDAPTQPLTTPAPLFVTGQVVITPPAAAALEHASVDPISLVERHVRLDPGNLDRHDQTENRWNVSHGLRILSEYTLRDNVTKIWLITESDRSVTTILLPEDY